MHIFLIYLDPRQRETDTLMMRLLKNNKNNIYEVYYTKYQVLRP